MTLALPSWNDNPARQTIIAFVEAVTDPRNPGFVPPAERVATFDNDGTLLCEKPMPAQIASALDTLATIAARDLAKRRHQPFKAAYEKDMAWFDPYMTNERVGEIIGLFVEAVAGETQAEFEARAGAWLASTPHPRFDVPYTRLTYSPMVELLDFLRQNGFKVFICSGMGMDFTRLISEDLYDVPREYVIGSNMKLGWEQRDGGPVIVRQAGLVEPFNDGPGKPINIQLHAGRPPILTGGNSDGDVPMMEFAAAHAAASGRPYLNLLVHHDDAEREYAYDRSAERALTDAGRRGWSVVSMKNDWKRVFAER